MNKKTKELNMFLFAVFAAIVLCDLLTPYIYRLVETDKTRTTFLLQTIQNKDFKPDVMIFGSSRAMYGVDASQMSNETGLDCYNFSSTGQPQEESSLYYSLLPTSVEIVVQVIFPPLLNKNKESKKERIINPNIVSTFYLGGYELSEDAIKINPYLDFSNMKENFVIKNYKSRGSIVIPAVTNFLISRDKSAIYDLYYPNGTLTDKHPMYNRTLEQCEKNYFPFNEAIIDTMSCNSLKEYSDYLNGKSISYVIVLMPINPDLNKYTPDECNIIGNYIKTAVPNAIVCNYLDQLDDNSYFYDAEHLNRKGAKIISHKLSEVIKYINAEN